MEASHKASQKLKYGNSQFGGTTVQTIRKRKRKARQKGTSATKQVGLRAESSAEGGDKLLTPVKPILDTLDSSASEKRRTNTSMVVNALLYSIRAYIRAPRVD